ncbi:hypothetical protein Fmac_021261 [Flemingia macrophylla]|uniref:Uncharacterized protein n=1 Tax=Flemingia macrophylla TaxID=520843 RepID=A0ABD1LWH9_9FABA
MSDERGVTNGIRAGSLTQYGVVRGRAKAEAGGHVTARTHRKERDPVELRMT